MEISGATAVEAAAIPGDAEAQRAQAPVLQETAVEAIFLEENSLEELQDPEEYSQDPEADSLEELQDPEEDFQLEDAIATTLTN